MAAHQVSFTIPQRRLGKEDITFQVSVAGKKWGRLDISKGAVVWFPRLKRKGYKMGWGKFDEIMKKSGARAERR